MSEGRYFYKSGKGYRLEVSKGWGLGLALCHIEDHASLNIKPIYGDIFIRLPKFFYRPVPYNSIMSSYGFSWAWGKYDKGRNIHFNWGDKCKIIYMPWDGIHIRNDILMADGTWKRVGKGLTADGMPWNWTDKFQETHIYTYTLRNGETQKVNATIGVEEREWRQKWLKWCPWFANVTRSIDVRFDGEVGERAGSWKGGTIGCGYTMLKDETPLDCLRRMERERTFN